MGGLFFLVVFLGQYKAVLCVCLCTCPALQAYVLAFLSQLQFILFLRGMRSGDKRGEGKVSAEQEEEDADL